jgi:hypothetical protein
MFGRPETFVCAYGKCLGVQKHLFARPENVLSVQKDFFWRPENVLSAQKHLFERPEKVRAYL